MSINYHHVLSNFVCSKRHQLAWFWSPGYVHPLDVLCFIAFFRRVGWSHFQELPLKCEGIEHVTCMFLFWVGWGGGNMNMLILKDCAWICLHSEQSLDHTANLYYLDRVFKYMQVYIMYTYIYDILQMTIWTCFSKHKRLSTRWISQRIQWLCARLHLVRVFGCPTSRWAAMKHGSGCGCNVMYH